MFQTRTLTKKMLSAAVFCGCLALASQDQNASEQQVDEQIVVTAHRSAVAAHEVGSSVTVITEKQIKESGQTQVTEILRQVPGLDIVRTGPLGQTTSIFMRGGGSAHTLVMLDGVPLNDAMSPGNAYDLAHLSLDNVERIEVVRGPQSTVYGSDAMSGVINVITKKGSGPLAGDLQLEAGSYQTQREALNLHGGDERLNYSLSAAHLKTDGLSAAEDAEEKDGYKNDSLSANLGYKATSNLGFSVQARHTKSDADVDRGAGVFADDPNFNSKARENHLKLGANWVSQDGFWQSGFSVAQQKLDRDLENGFDESAPTTSQTASYNSKRLLLNWQNRIALSQQTLVFGLDQEQEKGESLFESNSQYGPYSDAFPSQDAKTTSAYVQDHLNVNDRLAITAGARYDDHDQFGNKTTYRVATSLRVGPAQTYAKGSYGTGFKAPTLYQLYSPYGNLELLPEEAKGWDLGLNHLIEGLGLDLSLTHFKTDYENLIDYEYATNAYANLGNVETSGEEVGVSWQKAGFQIHAGYTRTKAEDPSGVQLVRRPKDKANLSLGYSFPGFARKSSVLLSTRKVGSRSDNDYVNYTGQIELDSYQVTDLAGSIQIAKWLELKARWDNLFDESYQEVFGYQTPGSSAYLGLSLLY